MQYSANSKKLIKTANALVVKGKGILAADESFPTIAKRFKKINLESTEENRRAYREILFTTPGAEKYISGVILFDETIRQKTKDGVPFAKTLSKKGIIPGIKVDKGTKPIPFLPEELMTEGLDGLRERLQEYYKLGARFAKWRAVIHVTEDWKVRSCVHVNAHSLALYAALCQEEGIVPIVEPEVLMDGSHDIDACEYVTSHTLFAVFRELVKQGVLLEGMLLKPNMVISGSDCKKQASAADITSATIRCFMRAVPAAVPGIVFLSGGQSDVTATVNLNEINKHKNLPWEMSFSYGRALQAPVLTAWKGKENYVKSAKQAFLKRAKLNGAARYGKYKPGMEK